MLAALRRSWQDRPLRDKGIVVVAIPGLALMLSAVLFYWSQQRADDSQQLVIHAVEIKAQLAGALAILVDAELGARGYLVSRSPDALRTYESARAALPGAVHQLRRLIRDPAQVERLRQLARRASGRPLSSIIDYVDRTQPGAPMPLELLARSRATMAELRAGIDEMQRAEDLLLAERAGAARRAGRLALGVSALAALLGVIGATVAARVFTATVARRIEEATANATRLAAGEPLLPMSGGGDEVGVLADALDRAASLLRERDEELQRRLADVAESNRELEAFSYSVSHDLRAPLRHIAGFASLLEKKLNGRLDAESTRYMQTIRDSAARMGRLVDDLLGFSRMGRADMLHGAVNLDEVVREVVAEVSQDTAGRKIQWNTHRLPTVTGDRALLRLALGNLVSNAVKYTGTRALAEIEIGTHPPVDGERVVYIRDNGVGFDMAYVDKLFGVFQRLHAAEEFEGTGIGLANVRRIVQRHGGRTWAEGAVDGGATFFIALPA